MRVVIAEQLHEGHYYTYARRVIEAVKELTNDITLLVTPGGLRSDEFKANLASVVDGINVKECLSPLQPGIVQASLSRVNVVRKAVKEGRPDVLYISTGDGVAEAVGLASLVGYEAVPRHVHSECLMTRLTFTYPDAIRSVPVPLVLAGLRRSPWRRIHLIDLLAYDWLRRNQPDLATRFRVIPDPVERFSRMPREDARRSFGLPEDGRFLVCPGILVGRKGINFLIEAFRGASTRASDRIVLAGPVGPDVRELLARPEYASLIAQQRVIVIDRYLNSEELGRVLCAADIVCCPYPHQWHPSSIAVKALACNRPVLGADSYWLGKMIPMFNMGWTVRVHDPEAFSALIPKALDSAAHWKLSEAARRLVQFQSVEQFKASWMIGLREKLGLPQTNTGHSWEWVVDALNEEGSDSNQSAQL
jgi:glycosyltransferase involved in cell wall biosynthesis